MRNKKNREELTYEEKLDFIRQIKNDIRKHVKWEVERPVLKEGEVYNPYPSHAYPTVLISGELEIKLTIGCYPTEIENMKFAIDLFEIILDKQIRVE